MIFETFALYIKILVRQCVAQAARRRPPTAAACVRAWVSLCGICGGQSSTGGGFLRVLRFSLRGIPPIAPLSSGLASVTVDSITLHLKKKKNIRSLYYWKEKVNLPLYLTNEALPCNHENLWESGCIDPRSLYFGSSWR
jgi:hypothetical protein